jgi:hypothetical protein
MKKSSFYICILFLTFGFCLINNGYSQDEKLSKQERKEARKAELNANFQALDTLIQNKAFVIEAQYLQNQRGMQVPVNSLLNFIKVDGKNVVLQTGSNFSQGFNDLGGITAQGQLQSWKVDKNVNHLSYTIRFSVTTQIGIYDVLLMVGADTNARATITGLSRGSLTYQGNIVAIYNSRIYKGRETL